MTAFAWVLAVVLGLIPPAGLLIYIYGPPSIFRRRRRPKPLPVYPWRDFCRMTCNRGSEGGACPCTRPSECQFDQHPDYRRAQATTSGYEES